MTAPSAQLQAEYLGPIVKVTRRIDVYESDATTLWMEDAPFLSGNVACDSTRDDRRTISLIFANPEGALDHFPGGFWYDKVLKVYRGFETASGSYEQQLGEFVIDSIQDKYGDFTVEVSGRDYTKKLLVSKFPQPTSFPSGSSLEQVIKTIAQNGGISKFILPTTGKTLGADHLFDRGLERFSAIKDLATSFGYEVFFNQTGYMVMQEPADPTTGSPAFTFTTGQNGTVAAYTKSTSDTRLYNHIVVVGDRADQVPVSAEAINNEPSSPTNVAKLGDRVYQYVSSFISTQAQAQDVADKFLRIHALEQYQLDLESIVIPWLDAGQVIQFDDPDPNFGDPTKFLLTSMNIPLTLGTMSGTGRRVTIV